MQISNVISFNELLLSKEKDHYYLYNVLVVIRYKKKRKIGVSHSPHLNTAITIVLVFTVKCLRFDNPKDPCQ